MVELRFDSSAVVSVVGLRWLDVVVLVVV